MDECWIFVLEYMFSVVVLGLKTRPEQMGSSMEEESLYEVISPKDPLIKVDVNTSCCIGL